MTSLFRLSRETTGILAEEGAKQVFHIPAGAEILVLGEVAAADGPPNRQVVAHWNGKAVSLFACDVRDRGELVSRAHR
jgi:hypothetical protein